MKRREFEKKLGESEGQYDSQRSERPPAFATVREKLERGPAWRSWLRELSRDRRVGLLAGVMLMLFAAIWLLHRRPHWESYPAIRMWAILGTFCAASLGAYFVALRPLYRPTVSLRSSWYWVGGIAALGFGVAASPMADVAHPAALAGLGAELLPRAAQCLAYGAAMGIPFVAAVRLLDRSDEPRLASVLMVGAGAGMAGNLALQIHCPIVHQEHLLLGHATVTLVTVTANLTIYLLTTKAP